MANVTISPNMNLPVPIPGQDPGPDWANNIVSCLNIIDSHNHSTDEGVQIQPSGIDITADLSFNGNNATTLRSARFNPQNSPLGGASDIGCLYESGVDLYYNDGNGNQVRITQSGSVTGSTGTITGLPSGTASASYSSPTFTFQSATNTPAQMAVGPLIIGRNTANPPTVTVQPSSSQVLNYGLTLPGSLPATQGVLSVNSSGTATFPYIGNVIFGPANKNTGALTPFGSSGTWQSFQTINLTAGTWIVFCVAQIKAGDNSTAFSPTQSIDFNFSAFSNSGTGVYGSFACMDYNSIYYSNVDDNSGFISSGSLSVVVSPGSTTTYYLNMNCTFTGSPALGRAGLTGVQLG
jgi:hypothetical protein